jgi:Spondin-like TSP1 domain
MSYGNYLQGSVNSVDNSYNVLLSGASSGYTSSSLMIGGNTSTMYGVKLTKDVTNNAYLDMRADLSNKMAFRHKDNTSSVISSMLELSNDSSLTSTGFGAIVTGRMKASSYYAGSIDTRAPVNTGVYTGYDGQVGYFKINKGTGSGGFSFRTYNADGTLLQNNLNLLASGVIQASYYTTTGMAADFEPVAFMGFDASGNFVRNYAANARFRALEARFTAVENDLIGEVPTKVNEIVTRLNGLRFFSQLIESISVFTPPVPVNCVVSSWSEWSVCDQTCGGGTQTRTRTVITPASNEGTPCPILSESRPCNTQVCPPVNCVVSAWSAFDTCSSTCGGGTQTQTRTIITPASNGGTSCPVLSQSQTCNTQVCTFTTYYIALTASSYRSPNGWTINPTTSYSIPTGFTFIGNWAFDPNYLGPSLTLSNNNQTVTCTGNSTVLSNYVLQPNTKIIVSATLLNDQGIGDNIFFGFAKRSFDLRQQLAASAAYADDGLFWINGGNSTGSARFQTNCIVDLAIDTSHQTMWVRVNGGSWNGDPATNSGGKSFSTLV